MTDLTYSNEVEDEHSIIQLTKSFFNRYIRNEVERNSIGEESILIGLLFGEVMEIKDLDFLDILTSIKFEDDDILRVVKDNFVEYLSNGKNLSIGKVRSELLKPLMRIYGGNIDKTRAKGLIGDLLTISLFEITTVNTDFTSGILNREIISDLKKDKNQIFLKNFLDLYEGKYEFLKLDFDREYNDLLKFKAMANALSQFLEYSKLKKMLLDKVERSNEEFKTTYLNHLVFLSNISRDIYGFIEREKGLFKPSDVVLNRFFFVASYMIKTEYRNTVSLNEPASSIFLKEILQNDQFFLKLIDDKVKSHLEDIINPEDPLLRKLNPIFNPMIYLKDRIGFTSSWVLWNTFLAILIILYYNRISLLSVLGYLVYSRPMPIYVVIGYTFVSWVLFMTHLIRFNRYIRK